MIEEHFCLDDSPEFRMVELDEVTSTNDFLRNYRPVGPERRMTLVTAEFQTSGRGAGSNHWESRYGENLLFSLLVHPRHIPADRMFVLSEVLALAIFRALSDFVEWQTANGKRQMINDEGAFAIKWPNDIYWEDKKICGMLIENELQGDRIERCVMGVGVNVNQMTFESDAPNPVSLAQIVGEQVERRFVLERIMEYFTRYYDKEQEEIHEMYLGHLYRKDEQHIYRDKDGEFRGTIVDVEPTGYLNIVDEMGVKCRYAFKEVEYV